MTQRNRGQFGLKFATQVSCSRSIWIRSSSAYQRKIAAVRPFCIAMIGRLIPIPRRFYKVRHACIVVVVSRGKKL
jgi:hypothetical protein